MITIQINDIDYSYDASPTEISGLRQARSTAMSSLLPAEGQSADTPFADRPGYIASNTDWLASVIQEWATRESADGPAIQACIARALASWSGAPAPAETPAEPLSPEAEKARLVAYALDKRWRLEVGGVTVGGVHVPTDDRAKLLLLGAAQSMADGSSAPLVVAGVNYGLMSKAQFQAINSAVVAHVQSTFPKLATSLTGIADGSITTTTEIDEAFA